MKKKKSKEAKFFCESCGSEVPRNSRVCPTCGKFFASVRCPHSLTGGNSYNSAGSRFGNNKNKAGRFGVRGMLGLTNKRSAVNNSNTYVESGLPFWVYLISIRILIALVIGLYSCL